MSVHVVSSTEKAAQDAKSIHDLYSTPAADIYETPDEFVILMDVPGVQADGLDLELDGNTLSITGRVSRYSGEGRDLLTEYRGCNYFRRFSVEDVIDKTCITAALKDGILKIVLPKVEHARYRRIPISERSSHEVAH